MMTSRGHPTRWKKLAFGSGIVLLIATLSVSGFCIYRINAMLAELSWSPERIVAFVRDEGEPIRQAIANYHREHDQYPDSLASIGIDADRADGGHWYYSAHENAAPLLSYKINWDEAIYYQFDSTGMQIGWHFTTESGQYSISYNNETGDWETTFTG